MADADATTTQTIANQIDELRNRAMCSELHDAILDIKGIADALHPVFSDLDEKEREGLIISIAPLAAFAKMEIDEIFSDLDRLAGKIVTMEASHEQ